MPTLPLNDLAKRPVSFAAGAPLMSAIGDTARPECWQYTPSGLVINGEAVTLSGGRLHAVLEVDDLKFTSAQWTEMGYFSTERTWRADDTKNRFNPGYIRAGDYALIVGNASDDRSAHALLVRLEETKAVQGSATYRATCLFHFVSPASTRDKNLLFQPTGAFLDGMRYDSQSAGGNLACTREGDTLTFRLGVPEAPAVLFQYAEPCWMTLVQHETYTMAFQLVTDGTFQSAKYVINGSHWNGMICHHPFQYKEIAPGHYLVWCTWKHTSGYIRIKPLRIEALMIAGGTYAKFSDFSLMQSNQPPAL